MVEMYIWDEGLDGGSDCNIGDECGDFDNHFLIYQ